MSFRSTTPDCMPLSRVSLPGVGGGVFDQRRNLFRVRDVNAVAGAGAFHRMAFGSDGIPAFIAAHMPDAAENEADDGKRFPSDLSKSGAIKKTADGFTYLDVAQFHEYFAADLPAEQAAFNLLPLPTSGSVCFSTPLR